MHDDRPRECERLDHRHASVVEGKRLILQRIAQMRFGMVPAALDYYIATAPETDLDRLADPLSEAPMEDILHMIA